MNRPLAIALSASFLLSACAIGPGPIQTQYETLRSTCNSTGNRDTCLQADTLAPLVFPEQQQREAGNAATAAAVGGVLVGALGILVAVAGASAPGNHVYHHHSFRRY